MPFFPSTKDPSRPTDILNRPLAEGDRIAYATSYHRGARLSVGEITRIRFLRKALAGYNEWEECAPADAERYTITARPEVWNGMRYSAQVYDGDAPVGQRFTEDKTRARPSPINKVENIIKVVV